MTFQRFNKSRAAAIKSFFVGAIVCQDNENRLGMETYFQMAEKSGFLHAESLSYPHSAADFVFNFDAPGQVYAEKACQLWI